jgi:nicotinamidase-related amidase
MGGVADVRTDPDMKFALSRISKRALTPAMGPIHPLDRPVAIAVIVVDLQTAFVDPAEPGASPGAIAMLPAVNALTDRVRGLGGTVAWTRHSWSDQPGIGNPPWFNAMIGPEAERQMRRLAPGSAPHALHPALRTMPADIIVDKYRPSAFLPHHADLHGQLAARGIETAIVCGTTTNFCCQSTARDALMRDYRVCFPPDLNAGTSEEAQRATLADLTAMSLFDMRPADALLAALAGQSDFEPDGIIG